jgi:hypothetical protein
MVVIRLLIPALWLPAMLGAQDCKADPRPAFEFQVEATAQFVGDSTVRPRPGPNRLPGRSDLRGDLIVQFVVDTLGQPVTSTFKVLVAPSEAAGDSARAALPLWRFSPARLGACKVRVLYQTSVVR